jgi:hypothetical protein
MKKWIFTLAMALSLAGLSKATVIFDPATYAGALPAGMEIVSIDGTDYLRVVLDAWNSNLTLDAAVDLRASETSFKCMSKFAVGTSGASMSNANIFIQLMSAGGNKAISNTLCTADFTQFSAAATGGMNITALQFAMQNAGDGWNAVVGDTLWVGKIIGYNPNAIFDPANFEGTLPAGMSIVDIDGEMYLKAALNGWSSAFAIDEFNIVTTTYNKFKVKSKYKVGTGGFALANINSFIQLANADYSKKANIGAQATADITEYIGDFAVDFLVSQLQVAGQERTNWAALVGDTIWVGAIEAYHEGLPPVNYVDPRKVIDIDIKSDDIEIDGLAMEDTWAFADIIDVENTDSSVAGYDAFKGNFMASWDNEYLYLFVEVTDPTPFKYDGADAWKKDGMQLYFDPRNQLIDGSRVAIRQHQVTIPYWGTPTDFSSWVGIDLSALYNADTNEVYAMYESISTATGYTMEMRIPWAPMYHNSDDITTFDQCLAAVEIGRGDILGFEMQLNDYNEATSAREHMRLWSAYGTDDPDAYGNSGIWGGLRLFDPNTKVNEEQNNQFKMYPNPSNSELIVEAEGIQSITVIDLSGREVFSKNINSGTATINVSDFNSGIYLVKVQSQKGTSVQKLQVN